MITGYSGNHQGEKGGDQRGGQEGTTVEELLFSNRKGVLRGGFVGLHVGDIGWR